MINNNNFIVGIKDAEGNLVIKDGDIFRIPFDTEYSIYLKNQSYIAAGVEILIDGTPIMGENKITLKAGESLDIDRFCIDGDLEKGNKLKFVSQDSDGVQDPTSEDNGGVEVRFYLEKRARFLSGDRRKSVMRSAQPIPRGIAVTPESVGGGRGMSANLSVSNSVPEASSSSYSIANMSMASISQNVDCFFAEAAEISESVEEIGATVEGQASAQSFEEGHKLNIEDEASTIVKFDLRGIQTKEDNSVNGKYKSKVAFVLDKSGSMSSIRRETVEAFNNQRKALLDSPENIETSVSLFTFESKADDPIIFDVPIDELSELSLEDYRPGGGTAMLDSVGLAIEKLANLDDAHEENTSFLLLIISDGHENSSSTYNYEEISNLICNRQNTGRWTVTYLGANQDLAEISEKMSINKGNIQVFNADSEGMSGASSIMATGTQGYTQSLSRGEKTSASFYSDSD